MGNAIELTTGPRMVLRDAEADEWIVASSVCDLFVATRIQEVAGALAAAERAALAGQTVVGFISYEAAPAFDPALAVRVPNSTLPLVWFGACCNAQRMKSLPPAPACELPGGWRSSWSRETYAAAFRQIKDYIASGDTYQINLTQRLHAEASVEPYAWFRQMVANTPSPHAAFLSPGSHAILSFSPELFVAVEGNEVVSRPMKGTIARGRWAEEDEGLRACLAASEKDRAENAMIVDMIRNDLGRIAILGSVRVSDPFSIETYPTVHQMTTTVRAVSEKPLAEIIAALFPCASVTGAPKVRSMQIIRELEKAPRGVYCGCIGHMGPGRSASFNVAIRTVAFEHASGRAEYGTGGGVVWDSREDDEYAECEVKARVLSTPPHPPFQLLETVLAKRGRAVLLEEHMLRLTRSARYFGFPCDADAIREAVKSRAAGFTTTRGRIRLLLSRDGAFRLESFPLERPAKRNTWIVDFAPQAIDPSNVFLYHKTTAREIYNSARAACPDADDVLLFNTRGELTESSIANVVLRIDGELLTPARHCGLLPGTLRARLLRKGIIREAVLYHDDLTRADEIYLINSLRGPCRCVPHAH